MCGYGLFFVLGVDLQTVVGLRLKERWKRSVMAFLDRGSHERAKLFCTSPYSPVGEGLAPPEILLHIAGARKGLPYGLLTVSRLKENGLPR